MSGVAKMPDYIIVMTDPDTSIVTAAHYKQADTDVEALSKIPDDQLKDNDFTIFQSIAASGKAQMKQDGRLDKALSDN